ncbi:shikimate kinase [uncultured Croceitalea sp.]|uniref:shikimate kinase n=1 Tax=uncultured Croceitalea sp. TaxID=1798908 RepID=UPI003305BEB1
MAKNLKVVLLGYMASGKSTVGRQLASALDMTFIDLDEAIAQDVGLSVPRIFQEKGELFFRKKETEVLNALLSSNGNLVLALGGGTPCYGVNMDTVLAKTAHSVYLKLSIAKLLERISNEKSERPLVANISDEDLPEFIGKHLFERSPFYNKASYILTCDDKSVDDIVEEVTKRLI